MSSFLQQINDHSFDLEPQVSALLKDLGGAKLLSHALGVPILSFYYIC